MGLLVVGGLAALLVVAVGSAAARPTGDKNSEQAGKLPPMKAKLDPVWVKGLSPKLQDAKVQVSPAAAAAARDQAIVVPTFSIKKLTPDQKGAAMAAAPAAIQGPLVYDSRHVYYDNENFLELIANAPSWVHTRTQRNYLFFSGQSGEVLPEYGGSWAELHFLAAPRTRYLLECAVDAGTPMTISATDERAQYSVSTSDKASLLYRRDNETAVPVPVVVRIKANFNQWYLDRCELSWTPMP